MVDNTKPSPQKYTCSGYEKPVCTDISPHHTNSEQKNHTAAFSDDTSLYSTTQSFSGAALAYLGDSVLEIALRTRLAQSGISDTGKLNDIARHYVNARAQSAGIAQLEPMLTQEETAVYHRGRNGAGGHPKSCTALEYRRATGLEALLGHLFLCQQYDRIQELLDVYFSYIKHSMLT